jgi:hypothetical protein
MHLRARHVRVKYLRAMHDNMGRHVRSMIVMVRHVRIVHIRIMRVRVKHVMVWNVREMHVWAEISGQGKASKGKASTCNSYKSKAC